MPAAYPAHLQAIAKELYLQGFQPKQIALKHSLPVRTIDSWVTKLGWRNIRNQFSTAIQQSKSELSEHTQNAHLRLTSSRVKSRLANTLDKSSEVLDNQPVNSRNLDKRVESVSKIAVAADKVFGWSAEATGPTHVSLTKIEMAKPEQQGPAIEVPYEP